MIHKIPPLNALRAFEACGRYLNIASAADELCVSPGAVSQQLKQLEKWLGHPLFIRNNRGLSFTDCGKQYHESIAECFAGIVSATKLAAKPRIRNSLSISATASFTMKWLLPKLEDFRSKWPDVEVILKTVDDIEKFSPEDADVGIRYGLGFYPGLYSHEIIRDELVVVGSPKLLQGNDSIPVAELPLFTLMVDQHPTVISDYPSWREYFDYFEIPFSEPLKLREFTQQWMVLQGAINGEGIALVKKSLVTEDIKSGNLVILVSQDITLETGYHFVCLNEMQNDPIVRSFEKWLVVCALLESNNSKKEPAL